MAAESKWVVGYKASSVVSSNFYFRLKTSFDTPDVPSYKPAQKFVALKLCPFLSIFHSRYLDSSNTLEAALAVGVSGLQSLIIELTELKLWLRV